LWAQHTSPPVTRNALRGPHGEGERAAALEHARLDVAGAPRDAQPEHPHEDRPLIHEHATFTDHGHPHRTLWQPSSAVVHASATQPGLASSNDASSTRSGARRAPTRPGAHDARPSDGGSVATAARMFVERGQRKERDQPRPTLRRGKITLNPGRSLYTIIVTARRPESGRRESPGPDGQATGATAGSPARTSPAACRAAPAAPR
jgi:hypothetical protein